MSYQALYRVWRPQKFADIVGQEAIATTLKHAVRDNKTSHAYLFTGPRGTGKTSAAKILAKAINCPHQKDGEPCNECPICRAITAGTLNDVIEIDAASNNGVEEIRDIRDKARYAPTEATYKVYIIDEVHMLSTGAFNALLKTLEEPPENVIFILATTEPHKIPATIISRTQRFDFKRIANQTIEARLAYILEQEQFTYEPGSLAIISRTANGGMRDALSLLDQVISFSDDTITLQIVREITGTLSEELLVQYIEAIAKGEVAQSLSLLHDVLTQGLEARRFVEEQLLFIRDLLLAKTVGSADVEGLMQPYDQPFYQLASQLTVKQLNILMRAFKQTQQDIRFTMQREIYLEVMTIQLADQLPAQVESAVDNSEEQVTAEIEQLRNEIAELKQQIKEQNSETVIVAKQAPSQAKPKASRGKGLTFKPTYERIYRVLSEATRTDLNQVQAVWDDLVGSLENMEAALLKQTYPAAASPQAFVVRFDYDILCQKMSENQTIQEKVQNKMATLLGHSIQMLFLTTEQWETTRKKYAQAYKAGTVAQLFGDNQESTQSPSKENLKASLSDEAIMETNQSEDDATEMINQAIDLFGEESVTIIKD